MARRPTGLALAGGGPLGAIYEIGALVALDEALKGLSLTECDIYVGVSSGAFIAAGLANGITPLAMYRMFIETDAADDPFEPDILLRPAFGEFARRLASLPAFFTSLAKGYLTPFGSRRALSSLQELERAVPTGIFDNRPIAAYLSRLFATAGRTDDFHALRHKLFIVATDLDSGRAVPFGASGWDNIPITQAVLASAALPGLFPPVEIGGRHYVDGALVKTLHASVALEAGVKLLLCVNPLVPFDAKAAADQVAQRTQLVPRGLPTVLSQTFRSLIYSRMLAGMGRYRKDYPGADVVLFEPERGDAEMFFANVFSYAERKRLSEHAYQTTRAALRRRFDTLKPILARHGVSLDEAVLNDAGRTLSASSQRGARRLENPLRELDRTLKRLELGLKRRARAR